MIYTYEYNSKYEPAMPSVELSMSPNYQIWSATYSAIVDSGADVTSIPIRILQQWQIPWTEKSILRGVTGSAITVYLYPLYIKIGSETFFQSIVGDNYNNEIIIGRDILNQMQVTLNGLAHMVEISQ